MEVSIQAFKKVEPDLSEECMSYGIVDKSFTIVDDSIELPDVGLFIFTGISGSGKTVCLREISKTINTEVLKIDINKYQHTTELKNYYKDTRSLASVGLSDIVTLLTPVCYLSDGQKYRLGLAQLFSNCSDVVIIDEFCNQLDELSTLGCLKLVERESKNRLIILATSRPYGFQYIKADVKNVKHSKLVALNIEKQNLVSNVSCRLGTMEDWKYFSQWHYRSSSPGIPTRIVVFSFCGHDFGVVVAGLPPLNISVRNSLFPEYKNNGKLVNKDIYLIHRIVISPEFRCLGLSKYMLDTVHSEYFCDKKLVELITGLNNLVPFATKCGFLFGGNLPDTILKKALIKLNFDFDKYLDDSYVINFINSNRQSVVKAVSSLRARWGKKFHGATLTDDILISSIKRFSNIKTKYYYKCYE